MFRIKIPFRDILKTILIITIGWYTPFRLAVIIIVTLFFWLTTFGDQGILHLHELASLKYKYTEERDQLLSEVASLEKEIKQLNDPEFLETTVRKELGYIKDGEVVYHLVP